MMTAALFPRFFLSNPLPKNKTWAVSANLIKKGRPFFKPQDPE
jgi:hypothetical protein